MEDDPLKSDKDNDSPSLEKKGIYYFCGEVNDSSTKSLIEFILRENIAKRHKELNIIINSPGGIVSSAFALIDIMSGSQIPINTIGLGVIASCGLLIFLHGKKRILTENSYLLSHQYSGGNYGKFHELVAARKSEDWLHNRLVQIYIKTLGCSMEVVNEKFLPASDQFIMPEEALKLGVATEIKNL